MGHEVKQLVFDNTSIKTFMDKCLSGLRVFYNSSSAKTIAKEIEDFGPDVIHVHNFIALVSPAVFFVAERHRVPVVMTLHNFRMVCPSATLFHNGAVYEKSLASYFPFDAVRKGVYRNSVIETAMLAMTIGIHHLLGTWKKRVDFYIALTSFSKRILTGAKVPLPADKVLVKPNAVPDRGMGTFRQRDQFLFVGRLVEPKGLRILLDAAQRSTFRLTIIGDGPMREEVIEHAKNNPRVTYLGTQNSDTVISHMKTCTALIFPALWYETLPLTVLEAFSTGTPVISSTRGPLRDLVQHGVNGLLFEPENNRGLDKCIEDILQGKMDVDMMSKRARETYLRYYTPERNYNTLITIYNKAIATKHAIPGKENVKLFQSRRVREAS